MRFTENKEQISDDRRIANLRPWRPGQSGNPGGRPNGSKLAEIRHLAAEKSERSLQRLVELVESEDERVAIMAAKEVLTWAFGSPGKQEDDGKADERNVTINIVKYTDGNQPPQQLGSKTISARAVEVP